MTPQQKLNHRQTVWSQILNKGLAQLWAPFMVDTALNYSLEHQDLEKILLLPEFAEECKKVSTRYSFYQEVVWNKQTFDSGLFNGKPLIHGFVLKLYGQIRNKLHLGSIAEDRIEEYQSVILNQLMEEVIKFKVGDIRGEHMVTWGLEAFFSNFACIRAERIIQKLERNSRMLSLDAPIGEDSEMTVSDQMDRILPEHSKTGFEVKDLTMDRMNHLFDESIRTNLKSDELKKIFLLSMTSMDPLKISRILGISIGRIERQRILACTKVVEGLKKLVAADMGCHWKVLQSELAI
jgi:hypothetical protein